MVISHKPLSKKDAALVARAFASVQGDLRKIQLFHTDRGSEFKNKLFDETLTVFQIDRSLSMKGCPYDNAVAEATFKIMKTEFINQINFRSLQHLKLELNDYVNGYNKHRIHGTLGNMSLVDYLALKKLSSLLLTVQYRRVLIQNVLTQPPLPPSAKYRCLNRIEFKCDNFRAILHLGDEFG